MEALVQKYKKNPETTQEEYNKLQMKLVEAIDKENQVKKAKARNEIKVLSLDELKARFIVDDISEIE